MARDRAGNRLTQAAQLNLASSLVRFRDQIGGRDRNDYLTFNLSSSSTVTLNLQGLKANADLKLLDQNGQVIRTSARRGNKPESIQAPLEQGNYFIRIYPGKGKLSTPYTFNLQYSPLPTQETTTEPPPPDWAGNNLATAQRIVASSTGGSSG